LRPSLFLLENMQLATMVIISGAACISFLHSWLQNHIEFKVFFVWLALFIKLCPERSMCNIVIFLKKIILYKLILLLQRIKYV
jgi:hypothetical protein